MIITIIHDGMWLGNVQTSLPWEEAAKKVRDAWEQFQATEPDSDDLFSNFLEEYVEGFGIAELQNVCPVHVGMVTPKND